MKTCSNGSLTQHNIKSITGGIDLNENKTCNKELVAAIIKDHSHSLRTYFYNRLRSQNDIEDFLQELYCRALTYKNPSKIRSIKKFAFTIALNLVRDNSRRCATRLRQNSVPIEPDMFSDESIEPERIIEHRHELKKASHTINDLHPNCKKAFLLNRIDGLSYKEVALKMGVTVSMVEKHLMLASKKIHSAAISEN